MFVSTFGRGVWELPLGPAAQTPETPAVWVLPFAGVLGVGGMAARRRLRGLRRHRVDA